MTTSRILPGIGILLGVLLLSLVAYAVFVFTSVGRFARYWDEQNDQKIDGFAVKVVALGDSTVQGIGATSPMKGFVGQVTEHVGSVEGLQLYNYSKTGAVAKDVLANQLDQTDVLKRADAILIAVGPNDIIRGVKREEYLKNYQSILDKLPKNRVVIATIPPLARSKISDQEIQAWNKDLESLAKKNGVKVAPIYQTIRSHKYDPRIYSIDLFHPSNYGYGLWANAFYDPLLQVLEFPEVIE